MSFGRDLESSSGRQDGVSELIVIGYCEMIQLRVNALDVPVKLSLVNESL